MMAAARRRLLMTSDVLEMTDWSQRYLYDEIRRGTLPAPVRGSGRRGRKQWSNADQVERALRGEWESEE